MIRSLSDVHAFACNTYKVYSEQGRLLSVSHQRKGKAEPGKNVPLSKNESGWKCYFRKLLDGFPISLPHTYTHTHAYTHVHTHKQACARTVHTHHAHLTPFLHLNFCFCSVKLSFLYPKVKKKIYNLTLPS